MKRYLFIASSIVLFFACSEQTDKGDDKLGTTSIHGKFINTNGEFIYLEDANNAASIKLINSQQIGKDGEFQFSLLVPKTGFYRLRISDNNFIYLILDRDEKVEITADATYLSSTYTLSGSEESIRLHELNMALDNSKRTSDSLFHSLNQHRTNQDYKSYIVASDAQKTLAEKKVAYIRKFIDAKPASLASLTAIEKLDPETDIQYYIKVVDELGDIAADMPYFINLKQKVSHWRTLAVGSPAPELILNDINGKPLALSSLQGKLVLVDFWASWCKPCRIENPNVVRIYNQYKDMGFTVLSVSMDGLPQQPDPRQSWIGAISQDGLAWENHVSELRGWNSSFIKTYNIQSIPLTYLVGKDGTILAKNLRGQELEQKVKEVLGG